MDELLPKVVKRLKLRWSDAKSFCAVSRYMPEIVQDWQREKRRRELEAQQSEQHDESRRRTVKQAQDRALLKALWDSIPSSEQTDIRKHVLKGQPPSLQKRPGIVERFCLEELARRKGIAMVNSQD